MAEERQQKKELIGQRERVRVSARSTSSVTRLGDLLDFGPLFKAFGNN